MDTVASGDYIWIIAFSAANLFLVGPGTMLMRRWRGYEAASRFERYGRITLAVVIVIWVTVAWGWAYGALAVAVGLAVFGVEWWGRRRRARTAGIDSPNEENEPPRAGGSSIGNSRT